MTMRRSTARGMVVAGALATGGCGIDDSAPSVSVETTITNVSVPVDPMFTQLCTVLDAGRSGEVDTAESTFDHGPLHSLADEAIPVDRGVAARLLEAKEAVESDFAAATLDAAAITADLEALADATAAALVATGAPVAPTCEPKMP